MYYFYACFRMELMSKQSESGSEVVFMNMKFSLKIMSR